MTNINQKMEYYDLNDEHKNCYEQKNVTYGNSWEHIPSFMYMNSNHNSANTDNEQELNLQLPHEQYEQKQLSSSSKNYKFRYQSRNLQRHFYKNKSRNNENCSENTIIGNSDGQNEIQQRKTPITLLNEWAMNKYGYGHKKKYVSYELVAVSGKPHRPVFTFKCQVQDQTAVANGYSKKEAKQNAAAQLWQKLFEINSNTFSAQHPTSTTNSDMFEVNEYDTDSTSGSKELSIMDRTDSDTSIEKLKSQNEVVQITQSKMNPIGTLQELSISLNWEPPLYSCRMIKLSPKPLFEVACKVLHLQTSGNAGSKKKAKHMAAQMMFNLIYDTGIEALNKINQEFIMNASKKDYDKKPDNNMVQEELEISEDLISAKFFRSFFLAAVAAAAEKGKCLTEHGSSCCLSNSNSDECEHQQIMFNQCKKEIEQYITNNNSNLKAVDKLKTLSEKLDFQVICVLLNAHHDGRTQSNSDQNSEYGVLVQVTTIPVFVSVGRGSSTSEALEKAACIILYMFQTMLLHIQTDVTSSPQASTSAQNL